MVRETVKRQAMIVRRQEVSQQEVDQLVHSPEKAQNMLREKLLNVPSNQLENAVSDIIDKCRDIVRLQKVIFKLIPECTLMCRNDKIIGNPDSDSRRTDQYNLGGNRYHSELCGRWRDETCKCQGVL